MPEASYEAASRSRFRPAGAADVADDEPKLRLLLAAFGAVFVLIALNLIWLQVVDAPNLARRAEDRRTNVVVLNAKRGTIYDRNGNVLAISVDCKDVVCDPTVLQKTVKDENGKTSKTSDGAAEDIADVLVEVLAGDRDTYLEALKRENTR